MPSIALYVLIGTFERFRLVKAPRVASITTALLPPPAQSDPSSPQITHPSNPQLTAGRYHSQPIRQNATVHPPSTYNATTLPATLTPRHRSPAHNIVPDTSMSTPVACECRLASASTSSAPRSADSSPAELEGSKRSTGSGKGKHRRSPSALDSAMRWAPGVRRDVRRAWPPRRSCAARRWRR